MQNIYLENKDLIISMNEHKIDGTGDKPATLDILVDCFHRNLNNFNKPEMPWYECNHDRSDFAFWHNLKMQVEKAKGEGDLDKMREEFYLYFRK